MSQKRLNCRQLTMGHFQVTQNLCFKARKANLMQIKLFFFYKKGFVLSLVLKMRNFGTRKWPISRSNF